MSGTTIAHGTIGPCACYNAMSGTDRVCVLVPGLVSVPAASYLPPSEVRYQPTCPVLTCRMGYARTMCMLEYVCAMG
eukprot:3174350-Rhodomonas_salina.2